MLYSWSFTFLLIEIIENLNYVNTLKHKKTFDISLLFVTLRVSIFFYLEIN